MLRHTHSLAFKQADRQTDRLQVSGFASKIGADLQFWCKDNILNFTTLVVLHGGHQFKKKCTKKSEFKV